MNAAPAKRRSRAERRPQPLDVVQLEGALLKLPTVSAWVAMSGPTIRRRVAAGSFPAPVKFGARCTRWRADDVRAWLAAA